jgi:hypothetical protein
MERFYGTMIAPVGTRGHWTVASVTNFKYSGPQTDLRAVLRKAWIDLRYYYPTIATLSENGTKIYESPDSLTLETWGDASFQTHNDITASEFFERLTKREYITLHYFPESHELLLQSEHHLIDGRGILFLWDRYYSLLGDQTEVKFGDEAKNLPAVLDDWVEVANEVMPEDIATMQAQLAPLMRPAPIRMPVPNILLQPGNYLRRELKLTVDVTSAVQDACKRQGISVTVAWQAAMIMATKSIQMEAGEIGNGFCSFTNFDVRPYFPESFDPRANPVACYSSGILAPVPAEASSFDEISAVLKQFYSELRANMSENMRLLPATIAVLSEAFKLGPPPGSVPIVSSIGILDKFLGRSFGSSWEIEDIWVTVTLMSAEIEAYLWSWSGRLVLSGSCNAAFYQPSDIDNFLARSKHILLSSLHVNEA